MGDPWRSPQEVAVFHRSLIIASAFVVAFSGTALAQADNFSRNTDRPGSDFHNFALRGNARDCQKICANERECRAWTFVKAGLQGADARCWLKNARPAAVASSCCTSGVIRRID
jgi:PAN domain-containing protein